MAGLLVVVVDDLKQVVLGELEHHEDALVLEHDLDEFDDVFVLQLGAEGHFSDGALGDARVSDLLALLVGLELFDGELARLAASGEGLVDATIGTAADETNNLVLVRHTNLGLICDVSKPTLCFSVSCNYMKTGEGGMREGE